MTDTPSYIPGEGPLTYRRVLREAWGMFQAHHLRVALVAMLLFVPPPILAALVGELRTSLEAEPGLIRGAGYVLGLSMVTTIRLLGPVVYAGYLDAAVGHEYFGGRRVDLRSVLRTLPWLRLLVADVVIVVGTAIGLALFVVPGIAFLTLFGLIGPVLVQERHGLVDGFRRTFRLSRGAWSMILVLVVLTIGLEQVAHEVIHERTGHSSLLLQVTASWAVAAVVGGIVGLIEVALATELMARDPIVNTGRSPSPGPPDAPSRTAMERFDGPRASIGMRGHVGRARSGRPHQAPPADLPPPR